MTALGVFIVMLALSGAACGQTLQGRDVNGDGIADAYYHVEQDLTWLMDANYYATQGNAPMIDPFSRDFPTLPPTYLAPGQVQLYELNTSTPYASSWVANLSIGDVQGWRMPNRLVPAGTEDGGLWGVCNATACYQGFNWPSEMNVLIAALGGGTGPFINVMNGAYMAATPNPHTRDEWVQLFNPTNGSHGVYDQTSYISGYVWAVHDGDIANGHASVTPVPEPQTYALMIISLAAVGAAVRRQRRAQIATCPDKSA